MKEFVFDLETLGTQPGAAVLTIGAVEIDRGKNCIVRTFYERIDLASCYHAHLSADQETLWWWHSDAVDLRARLEAFEGTPRTPIQQVVDEFAEWLGDPKEVKIYGKGPSFDCSIWRAACEAVGRKVPWHYRNERCIRTAIDFYQSRGIQVGEPVIPQPHNALHDAIAEATVILRADKAMDEAIAETKSHE